MSISASEQAAAALRDAITAFAAVANAPGTVQMLAEPSSWLRAAVDPILTGAPRITRCRHLRGHHGPRPAMLAVHRQRIECFPCAFLSDSRTIGTVEDRTCDRCRAVIPAGQVQTLVTLVGAVIVTAGHCADCAPAVRGAA